MLDRDYKEGKQPFIFYRDVMIDGQSVRVQIDLLAGEYDGATKSHRHQKVQDVRARKARGCDLAFEHPVQVKIEGNLPEGAKDSVVVRVASIVPFIVIKSMALADRLKEKDAWDIYYCLKNYPGGLDVLVDVFKPFLSHGLVKEGLAKIADKFASVKHMGPKFVADFEDVLDPDERERLEVDAFEQVSYLLKGLDII